MSEAGVRKPTNSFSSINSKMTNSNGNITNGYAVNQNETASKTSSENSIVVKTEYGPIKGFIHTDDENGTKANVFLGIPFAKPPVGELRFERPLPPDNWIQVLDATKYRDSCTPHISGCIKNNLPFSEDCLYLNVITPSMPSTNPEGYPVLVFIHGGGFIGGDVIRLGYKKIAKNFAHRGLITITIPYRVGIYGFMSLGTDEDPGNLAHWDQIAALKFIKNNAQFFGGNSNNITVWGQSAGSASADLLSLSPHSRDLFQKAIEGSGVASCEFANGQHPTHLTKMIAADLGCNSENPKEIKAFLKKQKWEDILRVSTDIALHNKFPYHLMGCGPRYDNDFFDGKTIEQLTKEAPSKPLLVGVMTLEAGTFIGLAGKSKEELATYSADKLIDTIKNKYAPEQKVGPEFQEIQKDIINFFVLREAPKNPTSDFYIQRHAELQTDLMFMQQIFNEVENKVKQGWLVYFYLWNHMSAPIQATLPAAKGAWHSNEIHYFFDSCAYPNDVHGPQELEIQNYFCDLIAKFAYNGDPSIELIDFPPYELTTRKSLWIDHIPSISSNFASERRKFWEKHTAKFNFNILRGRTQNQIINGSPLDI